MPIVCYACGHTPDWHDFDDDWSGCCAPGCYCKTFEYPPLPVVKHKPVPRPLFAPKGLTPEELRDLAKLDPREPYGEDQD